MNPTLETVEHLLYLMLRQETDVVNEMILPHHVAEGHYIWASYTPQQTFRYAFIAPRSLLPYSQPQRLRDYMVTEREFYFGWMGDAFGPCRLGQETVYRLADAARRKIIRVPRIHEGDPSDELLRMADRHLYRYRTPTTRIPA
jgi:hypothetical protein